MPVPAARWPTRKWVAVVCDGLAAAAWELVSGAVPVVETGVPSECVSVSTVAVDGEVRYNAIPSLGGKTKGTH